MENTQETKLCKHCQTEIPKKAKVCPNCRKKQGGIVKWIVVGVVVLILFGSCSGSEDSDNSSTITGGSGSQSQINNDVDDAEEVDLASQMNVEEYYYENTIGDTLYFLIVTNNSKETVSIEVNSLAKDAEGKLIGATDTDEVAVGSGETVCLTNYFNGVEGATSFEYTMTVEKDQYYESVVNDLVIEESKTDKKVILTCTNNGDKAARFVEAYALFFSGGELIGYDSTYITDDDSEIKAGATISDELSYYKIYDDVKVFVHGRK